MPDLIADPIAEQLAEWRERFTNRRTVPWELLAGAERIIQAAVAYQRDQVAAIRQEHDRELERLHEEHEKRVSVLKSTIESQRSTIASLEQRLDERRSLNEARRDAGDGDAEVTIRRDDYLRAWRLSDLEEIAFRLRCGGGTDDTPVDMASNRAIAVVPAPNLVPLEHRRDTPEPRLSDPMRPASPGLAARFANIPAGMAASALAASLIVVLVAAAVFV